MDPPALGSPNPGSIGPGAAKLRSQQPGTSLLRRGFNELYMALTVSNRCVEDAQAETGKAGSETSARSRSKKC
jgi:hypothetical protein